MSKKEKIRILNPAPGAPCFTSPERSGCFLASGKGRMRGCGCEFFPEFRERRMLQQADQYEHEQRGGSEDFLRIVTVHRAVDGGCLTYTQWLRK